jgi:hypothetical protein
MNRGFYHCDKPTKVIDTRDFLNGRKRVRRCVICDYKIVTYETFDFVREPIRITRTIKNTQNQIVKRKSINRKPVNKKLPDINKLIELYQTYSTIEIAAMYGTSWQAVAEQLRKAGATKEKRAKQKKAKEELQKLKSQARIEKFTNCQRCKTDPYAKGLCKTCYERLRKKRLSPEDRELIQQRAEPPKRPGAKRKPETMQKVQIIRQMKEQGKSVKEIIRTINLTESSYYKLLKRYEI